MKKSEKLKTKRKIGFKYFLLAHILTLFFVVGNFSFAADLPAEDVGSSFDFVQKNFYSEPFSKLVEFLDAKKKEIGNYYGNSLKNNNLNAGEFNTGVFSFLASVLTGVKDTTKNIFDSAKGFIFSGESQNNFEYLSPTSEENAKEIENLKQQYEEAIKEANELKQKFALFQNEMGKIKAGGVIVKEPVIEQRIVEKTVEKIISGLSAEASAKAGLSQTDMDSGIASVKSELANLNTNLTNKINNLSSDTSRQTSAVYNAVSLTNKIDSLSGTRLSNITVSGVTGLADSDIPDGITASSYLPLAGGTISGSLILSGQTTLTNATATSFTATNAWFTDKVGIGTTSPYAKLSVVGPVVAEYFHATSTAATSTFSGQLVSGFAPTLAHSFGSWSVGVSGANPLGASLAINPSSATADSNLLSLSVSGSAKFLVDAEGDVFANGVTVVGGTTLSNTTAATFTVENNTVLGDSTTTDITYFNSRVADSLIPTADNALDLGDSVNWLRWRTGYFGTSVGIGGTATSTGSQLTTSGAYLIDSNNTFSINTTNNKAVSFGTGNVSLPYASSTALTVTGSTYLTGLGQGWIHTAGGVNALSASTSPTVNYIVATSTAATSTFPYLSVTTNSNLGTVVGGTWQGAAVGDAYLTKSGDWTGTLDTYEAANLLARANHTGTQGVATLSNYDLSFANNYGTNNLTASTTMPWWAQGGLNASSTSHFLYASSTALTVSGNSYLGTVSSGAWNGTAVSNQYGGTGLDSSALTGIAQIVAGTWSASSTLSTAFGGTGWNSIQANTVLLGNGAGRIATTSAGTDGYVLALSGGIPAWVATTTLSTITGTLAVGKGGTGQTSFGQGWLNSDGTTLSASTSPTVNYIVATSTTATSTFAGGMSVAGTAGLTVLQNGNVGIGTAAPGAGLEMSDAGGSPANRLRFRRSDSVDASGIIEVVGSDNIVDWSYGVNQLVGDDFEVNEAGSTNRFVIKQGGNVGIGTAAPGAKLDISRAHSATFLRLLATGVGDVNQYADLDISNSDGPTPFARIRGMSDPVTGYGGTLSFWTGPGTTSGTAPTEKMRINATGNVGIGTAAPTDILTVRKDLAGDQVNTLRLENLTGAQAFSGSDIVFIANRTTGGATEYANITGLINSIDNTAYSGEIVFNTAVSGTLNERMRINDLGNVGIGTASPAKTLHLYRGAAGGAVGLRLEAVDNLNSDLDLWSNNNLAGFTIRGYDSTDGNFKLIEKGTGNTYMVINPTNGNVGIGTTTPGTGNLLDVYETATHPIIAVTRGDQADASGGLRIFGSDDVASTPDWEIGSNLRVGDGFEINQGTSNKLYITRTGSVGIGTTSPWKTLSVTGTVGFDGLTGATGAGSLCLDSNKQVVYNSASDACLSSTRATKYNIANLDLNGISLVNQLQPSSFVYNQGDGRTRYGFIAEDTALIDDRLATHNEKGEITGIDDRAIMSVAIKAIQEMNLKVSDLQASAAASSGTGTDSLFAWILDKFKTILGISFENGAVKANKICVGETCVTEEQFKAVFGASSASSVSNSSSSSEASSSSAESSSAADDGLTATTTSSQSSSSESSSSSETSSSTASSTESSSSVSSAESSLSSESSVSSESSSPISSSGESSSVSSGISSISSESSSSLSVSI